MISVVCAAYNAEKYIKESINSVLNQTYKDIEIVVIDDGSTDNTVKCLEEYKNLPNFRFFKKSHTGNVGKILNQCISIAKGEFIAIMSADDIWMQDKLEKQILYLDKYEMVCTNAFYLYEENQIFKDINSYGRDLLSNVNKSNFQKPIIEEFLEDVDLDLIDLLKINYIVTVSVVIKREEIIASGGFDEDVGIRGEDYYLWLNFCKRGKKIRFMNESLVNYRIHGTNLSFSSYLERQKLLLRFIQIREQFASDSNKKVQLAVKEGCAAMYHELSKVAFKNKDYISSKKYWGKFLRLYSTKTSPSYAKYLIYYLGISTFKLFKGKGDSLRT